MNSETVAVLKAKRDEVSSNGLSVKDFTLSLELQCEDELYQAVEKVHTHEMATLIMDTGMAFLQAVDFEQLAISIIQNENPF